MDNYNPDPFSQNNGSIHNSGNENNNSHAAGNGPMNNNEGQYQNSGNYYNSNNNAYGSGTYNNGGNNAYGTGTYNNGYNSNAQNNPYNNYAGYNNNNRYNYYNNGGRYNNGYPVSQCPSFALWLVLGILCALFSSRICGVIGIIYLLMANNSFKAGNYPQYESQIKTVKIALLAGLIIGIALFMIGFVAGLTGAVWTDWMI